MNKPSHEQTDCESRGDVSIDRRQFLLGVAGAAATVLAPGAARLSWAEPPATRPSAGEMTLGFGTYATKALTTEDAIAMLRKTGFDSVMLCCMEGWDADPARVAADRRKALRKQFADIGLKLPGAIEDLHPSPDDKQHAKHLERLKLLAGLLHDLTDSPVIIETVLGGKGAWEKSKPLYLKRLPDWVKLAQTMDFTLSVKPHRGNPFSLPEQAKELIDSLGKPPHLRFCYDYGHYVFIEPMEQTIQISIDYVGNIVVKDVVIENGKASYRLAGETGQIDYASLLKQFYQLGYRGDVSCEVSTQIWRKPGYDPVAAANTCYQNMSIAFKKAGVPRPGGA